MTPEQFTAARRRLSDKLARTLVRLFTQPHSWRDTDRDVFLHQAVPLVEGAQRQLGAMTALYVASQASAAAGRTVAPAGIPDRAAVNLRRGVDTDQVYERPFTAVYTALSKGKPLTEAVELGQTRLREITELDLQATYAAASREAMEQLPPDAAPQFWRRQLVGSENCALCTLASTQRYHLETLNPIHPGCVPGHTQIRARGVSVATRRWYAGELAVIATAGGDQVSVTPQHPVLTDRGWVPGHLVRPGDYLIRSRDPEGVVLDRPDEGDVPVRAEEVWRSISVMRGFGRVPLAAEDFHGDGSDGEVDVVRTDRYFTTERDREKLGERLFVTRHGRRLQLASAGSATPREPGLLAATHCPVGRLSLSGTLLGGHARRAYTPRFRWAATRDSRVGEPAAYNGTTDPLLVSDDVLGEATVDVVNAKLFDRVTDVRRVSFRGHVYNFQCETGTYEANNHIVHNCDCRVEPFWGQRDPGQVIDEALLERVHSAVQDLTGTTDRGGREPDYRKIVLQMTQEHGELGPMLARPLDHFTTEGDL